MVAGGLRQTRQRTSQVITKKRKTGHFACESPVVEKKAHQKNLTAISDDGELGLMQLMAND